MFFQTVQEQLLYEMGNQEVSTTRTNLTEPELIILLIEPLSRLLIILVLSSTLLL